MPQVKRKPARKLPKKLSESYLRNAAIYYLQRHPASVAHFLTVMARKMARSARVHPDQDLDSLHAFLKTTLVPELERAGLLNDALYAKALTTSLQRRGLPKRIIAQPLATRGVTGGDSQLDEQTDFDAAQRFAKRKRLGPFALRPRDAQKDLAAMARAGFSYDVAQKVLRISLMIEDGQDHL